VFDVVIGRRVVARLPMTGVGNKRENNNKCSRVGCIRCPSHPLPLASVAALRCWAPVDATLGGVDRLMSAPPLHMS
jgi:hypothetical protein